MARSSIPPLEFRLSYDTASSLQHLILAQIVHAQQESEKGFPILLKNLETIQPFLNKLSQYLQEHKR